MKKDKIFFQLYNPTGMINQVMSLELAVGLAHETNRQLIIHYLSNNGDNSHNFNKVPIFSPSRFYNDQRKGFTDENQFPHLTDILEWEFIDAILIDEKIPYFPQEDVCYEHILGDNYYSRADDISNLELSFAEGRSKLIFPHGKNVHLKFTLGWYSRFFFERSKELDACLNSVRFKKEYYDLADLIADSLGKFQGAHLRLSDHVNMFNTTQIMFEDGLSELEKNGLPIVISTDQPTHEMVVQNKSRFILLDEYIINNFGNEFQQLKFKDEVVFGLICNLVMHKAKEFIGTSGSTYTGYIQRKRNQNGLNEKWSFFDKPEHTVSGPYSWTNYPLENGQKMWWREWPESKLDI